VNSLDLGGMFLLGLVGSTHCVGMCGGFVVCLQARARVPVAVATAWHLGRLLAYATLGALLGTVGMVVRSQWDRAGGQAALLVASAGMILAGLVLLGLAPQGLLRVGSESLLVRRLTALLQRGTLPASLAVGGFTGLLPCGLLYAALARAVATDSPWQGATLMAAFALGTMPALAGVALLTPLLRGRMPRWWPRLAGLAVLAMGILTLWGTLTRVPAARRHSPAAPTPGRAMPAHVPPSPSRSSEVPTASPQASSGLPSRAAAPAPEEPEPPPACPHCKGH